MHVPVDQDSTSYTECQEERDEKGPRERVLFKPQVTVNVYNTGGSGAGGTTSDGLTTDDSGTSTISGNGSALGDGPKTTINSQAAQIAALTEKVEQLSLAAATQRQTPDGGPKTTNVRSLAAKFAALTEMVEQLSLAVATQHPTEVDSGSWNTNDVRSWKAPRAQTSGRVDFSKPFRGIPKVMVSMNCADVDNAANFRVRVYATDIDLDGFTIHADSWADTRIYSCGVSWTAIGKKY